MPADRREAIKAKRSAVFIGLGFKIPKGMVHEIVMANSIDFRGIRVGQLIFKEKQLVKGFLSGI